MTEIVDFLRQLSANNNREWFAAHKGEYLRCKAQFDAFAEEFIAEIRKFDDNIGPMTVKDCTYRIYRDVRFSADKSPYKTHFGVFVCPGGKKSGCAGYYFQVGAEEHGYPGGCMLASGHYCIEPRVLKMLREDITLDDGQEFFSAINAAKGFELDFENSLKRVPNGFPADKPYSDLLRLKNFCLVKEPGVNYILQPNLIKRLMNDFQSTKEFLHLLNRAITYQE